MNQIQDPSTEDLKRYLKQKSPSWEEYKRLPPELQQTLKRMCSLWLQEQELRQMLEEQSQSQNETP